MAVVGVSYTIFRVTWLRLLRLIRPVDSPMGTTASPSFELVTLGQSGEIVQLSLLDPAGGSVITEPPYEEVAEESVYMEVENVSGDGWAGCEEAVIKESEDEGVWVEGDAGFTWEDTRLEQWRWEAEQGTWEDVSEGGCEERGHEEDEDKDEEEEDELWE